MYGFGLARSMLVLGKYEQPQLAHEQDAILVQADDPTPVAPAKDLLNSMFDQTVSLNHKMYERKRQLEATIKQLQEDLRQVEIVLAASHTMIGTIADGIEPAIEIALTDLDNDPMGR